MSKLTVTALMSDSCPGKVCLHAPSLTSHNLAEASQAPDTKQRMSGDNESDITSPVCPTNVVHCCLVSISHNALRLKKEIH